VDSLRSNRVTGHQRRRRHAQQPNTIGLVATVEDMNDELIAYEALSIV
jgi:hypothetical protein